jgi:hypothetical protein
MPRAISEKKPWKSQSIGCNKRDVAEHNEQLKKLGVRNAYIDVDGRAVAHSNKGRNDLMKAYTLFDKDGGYGQHTGN